LKVNNIEIEEESKSSEHLKVRLEKKVEIAEQIDIGAANRAFVDNISWDSSSDPEYEDHDGEIFDKNY
jgi:hypothetical protein